MAPTSQLSPYHLFRCVDWQAFRFNTRLHENGEEIIDGPRFNMAMQQIVGRRLTYKGLIGSGQDGDRPSADCLSCGSLALFFETMF